MSFSGKNDKAVYILFSIKHNVGKDMDSGHYVCDVLDYNTGTWWICGDDRIKNYTWYTDNVYDELSH